MAAVDEGIGNRTLTGSDSEELPGKDTLDGTSTTTVPSCPRSPGEAIVLVITTEPAYGVVIVV